MTFLEEAIARGFVHQCTDMDGLSTVMKMASLKDGDGNHKYTPFHAYIGFDCTANSLHIGSLVQIMMLRLLQKHGYNALALIGGATTKIGDPTGKDTVRKMLSDDEIHMNGMGIMDTIMKFELNPKDCGVPIDFINNLEWTNDIKYLSLLREIGVHFTINRMLTFDSVKTRLERESPMTFLEFNYMILQSYDFLELNRRFGLSLQIGGSDQWGNIVSGVDLVRRMTQRHVFGLTTPLIETASGTKMGKTESGTVWLDSDKTSVMDYWQFWRNTDDRDVIRFLKMFTDLPLEEISKMENLQGAELNDAKRLLADEACKIAHGDNFLDKIYYDATIVNIDDLRNGIPAHELFYILGLEKSKAAARRLIKGNGAKINDVLVTEDQMVTLDDVKDGRIKFSAGQKRQKFVIIS